MQYNSICPICKKPFYITSGEWVYKKKCFTKTGRYDGIIYYCSWSCFRKAEKTDFGKHYDIITMRFTNRKKGGEDETALQR